MFWIGLIVGGFIATIAFAGLMFVSCWHTFGSWDTFNSMVDVVVAANENRESEVRVYHDGECLDVAVFEER